MNTIQNLILQKPSILFMSKRYGRKHVYKCWKNDWLPFEWTRPEPLQGYFDTGDRIERIDKFDGDEMPKAHRDAIEEVGDVPPEIQKMLTYKFDHLKHNAADYRNQKIYEQSNTKLGLQSLKGSIIDFTYKIRRGRQILRDEPNNVQFKILVNKYRFRRQAAIHRMNQFDRAGLLKLLAELEVDVPKLEFSDYMKVHRIERKKELRRLTKEYCDNIVQKRLNAYHEKLKEEQKLFEKEKEEFEQWMSKKIVELNLDEESLKVDSQ